VRARDRIVLSGGMLLLLVLKDVTLGGPGVGSCRLRVLGVNPCSGVLYTWIPEGDCPGNLSLGRHTGDGKSDAPLSNNPILIYIIC
jgi:hypothetical protein